jgi:cytochrome c556
VDAAGAEEETVTRAAAAFAAVVLCAACGGPEPPPFKPVADIKQLMQGIVDPSADVVWDSVKTTFTKDGMDEHQPRTEAEWANVRNHAMMLSEAGNLLMMPPRAKDGGEWMTRAQELIDTASVALRAAEAKNVDQLYLVGGLIDEACENCHKKYWPNY